MQVEPLDSAHSLAREIASSLFAFLPYSFSPELADMVRTSFPSKLMEYLAYARSIVAFAPDYANSTAYFRGFGLPQTVLDQAGLEAEITRHMREMPVYSARYRAQLARVHSPAAARQTLLATLSGKSS